MYEIVTITAFDEKGKGLGRRENKTSLLTVPFAYPGDRLAVNVTNRSKKLAEIIEVLEPSPDRIEPPCPYAGYCGGCPWQGLSYPAQLKHKEALIKQLFGESEPIIPSPKQFYFRNRMDFAFGPNFTLGLRRGKSEVLDLKECLLLSEKCNRLIGKIKEFTAKHKLLTHPEGPMRHVIIREGKKVPNTILNFLTNESGPFPLDKLWPELQAEVQGITWSLNRSPADLSVGEIQATRGQDHYFDELNGLRFKIPVQSFFQTNPEQAEKLILTVAEFLDLRGGETLLDLYSGTGSIGLSLAKQAKTVIGFEEDAAATALSLENARLNGIGNYSATAGRAEEVLPSFEGRVEAVVVDPPRPGLHKKVIRKLGELKPEKLVYVSCNPRTQKIDVEAFKEFGYRIKRCQPLDMFPHTPHLENILLLTP
ncbi:MAG: 23S rRNA (uracil(1939)-C(5))-methyltransferase RlmD [Candidatus Margulisiibacteriota bacterium]|jgi:23S rRNA (uracil-5-)-methyltransferase RumA